jgi:hypothetical protein
MGPGGTTPREIFDGPLEAFRPFSLAPHHYRVIRMSVVFHRCQLGEMGINSSEMSFGVLGQKRTQMVPWPFDLTFTLDGRLQS